VRSDVEVPLYDGVARHVVRRFEREVADGGAAFVVANGLTGSGLAQAVLEVPWEQRDVDYWLENAGFFVAVAALQARHTIVSREVELGALRAVATVLDHDRALDAPGRAALEALADELRTGPERRRRAAAEAAPPRLLPGHVDEEEVARLWSLFTDVIDRTWFGDDGALPRLVDEWNRRTGRSDTLDDIRTMDKWSDEDVRLAAAGSPRWIEDLSFDEACRALRAVRLAALSEHETRFVLDALERNLPGSDLGDLVYHPDDWFGDTAAAHLDLSAEQAIGYAVARSGRRLAGAPALSLPRPDPRAVAIG
jgi:hypothetical protein